MTPGAPDRPSWGGAWKRGIRLYFAPFVRVDPAADKEAGPFAQRFQRWALAVTAVAGAGVGISQFVSPQPFTLAMVTGANEWTSKELPEKSVMYVEPDTSLTVRVDSKERRIDVLRGEALFKVAHESPSRPFIVYAGTTQTRAVGTQFSVIRQPSGEIRVTVMEGEVNFKNIPSNGAVEERALRKGAGATLSHGRLSTFSFSPDEVRRVFWEHDTLHMGGATIGQVVAQLNLRESQRIVIDDPSVAATLLPPNTFVGQYSLERFLAHIEATQPGIEVQRREQEVHLAVRSSR